MSVPPFDFGVVLPSLTALARAGALTHTHRKALFALIPLCKRGEDLLPLCLDGAPDLVDAMWSNELGLFERWERSHGDLLPLLTIVADTPKHADAAFERIGGERGLGAALKGKNKAMACAFAEKIALFGKAKEVEAFVQTFSSIASSLIKEERYFTPEEEAISRNRDFAAAPQIAALRVLSLLSRKGSAIALKEMTKVAAMQLNTWLELSATQRQFRYVMCTTIVDCLGDFL